MVAKTKRPNFLDEPAAEPAAAEVPDTITKSSKRQADARPDRVGKRGKLFYMNEAAEKQLSILAIEQDITQQDLLIGAVNALFVKHGKPPIA